MLFRSAEGEASCVRDECAHRACPLSLGSVDDGKIVCPYHGWQYDSQGNCTHMPSTAQRKGVVLDSLTVSERDGFVWVWPGDGIPTEVGCVAGMMYQGLGYIFPPHQCFMVSILHHNEPVIQFLPFPTSIMAIKEDHTLNTGFLVG